MLPQIFRDDAYFYVSPFVVSYQRRIEKALTSPYYALVVLVTNLCTQTFSSFPNYLIRDLLLDIHGIQRPDYSWAHKGLYNWPEARKWIDTTLEAWEKDPTKLGVINRANLIKVLATAAHGDEVSCSPVTLLKNDLDRIAKLADDLHPRRDGTTAISVTEAQTILQEINRNRREKLREQIEKSKDKMIENHRDYYLEYFGFNDADAVPDVSPRVKDLSGKKRLLTREM